MSNAKVQSPHRWLKQSLYRHVTEAISGWFNFTIHHGKNTFNTTYLTCLPGLVGNITLNKKPLRDFIIYSLDMKADFVNRFASFIYFSIFHFIPPCLSFPLRSRPYPASQIGSLLWTEYTSHRALNCTGNMVEPCEKIPPKHLMGWHADTATWCILNHGF